MKRILREMFGLDEATHPKHAETELNMGQSVAQAPRKYTRSTAKAQSDIDSSRSLVKKESTPGAQGLRLTGDEGTMQALLDVIQYSENDEYGTWCDAAADALRQAIRSKSGTASLPAYQPDAGENDFNDYEGPGPEGEE